MRILGVTFSLTIFMLFFEHLGAQDTYFPDRVVSSPTAAGLMSAIEFTTDLSSGKPSITIPLYTVERDGISIPISLSYNAQGIKVNQVAGYAGLNWNFNIGGSVTRLVNALHDEFTRGYMDPDLKISDVMDVCSSASPNVDADACENFLYRAEVLGEADLKPDEFYFQFGAYSGKFFYDQEQYKFVFQSKQDLAIEYFREAGSPIGKIVGFRFTAPLGIKYYFGMASETDNSPVLETKTTSGVLHSHNDSNIDPDQAPYYSLWPLRRIVTVNGQEINFHYSYSTERYNTKGGEWISEYEDNSFTNNVRVEEHNIQQPQLDSIDFGLGKVVISQWTGTRLDYIEGTALGTLAVLDQQGNQVKKFNFDYDHYSTDESLPPYVLGDYQIGVKKRLRLISAQEEGKDGGLHPPYLFGYNGNYLPSLYNTGQDFWGYYNGQQNGNYVKQNIGTQEPEKKRAVNPLKSSVGVLNKISYPTGGYTSFSFESNRGRSSNNYAGPEYYEGYIDPETVETRSISIEKLVNQRNTDNEFWDSSARGYVIDFVVESGVIPGQSKIYMDLPESCPMTGHEHVDCPYLVRLDGDVYPNAFETLITDFSPGFHTLEILPQNEATIDPNDYFFEAIVEWKIPEVGDINMGGLRVKSISSYSSVDQLLFKKDFYYRYGISVSLPSFIENIYIAGLEMPCNSANQFGNHELVGTGYEYPHYVEVYEDNFSTISGPLPDGSPVPPYSKVVSRFFENEVYPGNQWYLHPYPPPDDLQFQMNKLASKEYYNGERMVKRETYGYLDEFVNIDNYYAQDYILGIAGTRNAACAAGGNFPVGLNHLNPATYKLYSGLDQVQYLKEIYYDNSLTSTTFTKSDYDSDQHSQLTRTTVTGSTDNVITEYFYADDLIGTGEYIDGDDKLNQFSKTGNLYRPALPLITKSYRSPDAVLNGHLVSNSQLIFDDFGANVSVSEQWSAVGNAALERDFIITKKNSLGKPLEVTSRDGVTSCFIWGYGGELLIGTVTGISYDNISQDVDALVALSNADIDEASEDALRSGILTFITTYPESQGSFVTYDPLVGVTSQTDPNGQTTYYEYDGFNRLKLVRDVDENVLIKHNYHYKNQ